MVVAAALAGCWSYDVPQGPALEAETRATPPATKDELHLQKRIDDAAKAGGGTVVVPAGEWETKPLILKSNVTLRLEKGATLLASTNIADYAEQAGARVFIFAADAKNVAIEGEGAICGRGGVFREKGGLKGESQPQMLPVLMRFARCRGVRLEDFSFRDGAAWGCHLMNCDGVLVRRMKAFNHVNNTNDGIDIESRNVLIEDCDIDTDDDAVVFKTESDKSFVVENVEVRNCRLASCCNAIKFGTGSHSEWRNIDVHDCIISRAKANFRFSWHKRTPGVTNPITGLAAIALEVVDGGRMNNVKVRNIEIVDGFQTPIFIRHERRNPNADGKGTHLRNVLIENVKGRCESHIASSITGVPGLRPSDITLRNITLEMPGGCSEALARKPVPECEKGYPDNHMFGYAPLPAWGFYVRHADRITFENVTLTTKTPDPRPKFVLDDCTDIVGALPPKPVSPHAGQTVKASDFGWNAADATKALQAALDSGAAKVVVDKQAGDWIVTPIFLRRDNLEVVLADGVVVRAKKDAFKGRTDCLFCANGVKNLVFRGEGNAKLVMNKADYVNRKKYAFAEWRHTFSIVGGENVTVKDLRLESSGGDGVYVRSAAKNVRLENLTCRDHNRQGISVISVDGLYVRNCLFNGTWGAPPQCGIDIEPNTPKDILRNLVFEDCVFDGNYASGIDFYLANLTPASEPIGVVFRRCVARGNNNYGIVLAIAGPNGCCRGNVLFEDCAVAHNKSGALMAKNIAPKGLKVHFRNCLFDARGSEAPAVVFGSSNFANFTGVTFARSRVLLDPKQQDIDFVALAGVGVESLSSTLDFARGAKKYTVDLAAWGRQHPGDPSALSFSAASFDSRKLKPVAPFAKLAKPASTGRLRDTFTFLQYVPAAGDYPIAFKVHRIRERAVHASFQFRDRVGTDLGRVKIPEEGFTYTIKATGENLYQFEVSTGGGLVEVVTPYSGAGVRADAAVHLFGGSNRDWCFAVPPGGEEVAVCVTPEEPCSAELVAPDGKVVDAMPFAHSGKILHGRRAKDDKGGIWHLRFPKVQEDAKFRLGRPATPVISPTADAAAVLDDVR